MSNSTVRKKPQKKTAEHAHLQRIVADIKKQGGRVTDSRKRVIAFLCKQAAPVTIKDLELAIPSVNIVTLYRILDFLVQHGAAVELTHDPKEKHFELSSPYHQHHHHAVCTNCDRVIDVKCAVKLPEIPNFKASSHSVTVYGTCTNCVTLD